MSPTWGPPRSGWWAATRVWVIACFGTSSRTSRGSKPFHASEPSEADALHALAHLPANHRRRDRLEQAAADAYQLQCTIEPQRCDVPKRALLRDTELSRRLHYHPGRYKTVVDTLRIALANVETDLAKLLAPHLKKPREAKKTLANLFAAAGTVRAGSRHINISLEPAATSRERRAFEALLAVVNRRRLALPGDPPGRPLRFRIARS